MKRVDFALEHGERGLYVFPLKANAKTPLTPHGFKDASIDPEQISAWWTKWPNANIGIATGQSNLTVLDIDVKDNVNGEASLEKLLNGHINFPTTLEVSTPTGGRHLYFKTPKDMIIGSSTSKLGDGLDVKSEGGYVVAAGSFINGEAYRISRAEEIATAPIWFTDALAKPNKTTGIVTQGRRNDTTFRYASKLRADGIDEVEAKDLVLEFATKCQPPLDEVEALRCLESAWRYSPNLHLTDLGNGQRLVIRHGKNIRFLHNRRKWLLWDGFRWIFDDDGSIIRLAKDTAGAIYNEAAQQSDDARRAALSKHATSSESLPRLKAMVELAESEYDVPVKPDELDRNKMLLGVRNGTIDLLTGALREPMREDMITKSAGVVYDLSATCPNWLAFLDGIMGGDNEMTDFLRRVVGYSLTGITSEQCMFMLYGTGANGKSTFLNLIGELLGDYASNTPADSLMVHKGGGVRNDIARLPSVRFVTAIETEDDQRIAEALVKSLTGGDVMTTRFLYGEFFDFVPQLKLFLAANHKPIIKGDDHAIWRRVRLIPFEMTFAVNKHLPIKLQNELSGILNWAIEGCLEWQKHGLQPPSKVMAATDDYRADMDYMHQFIEERCNVSPSASVGATELYTYYQQWAEDNTGWTLTQTKFGRKLAERGYVKEKTPWVRYRGIELKK